MKYLKFDMTDETFYYGDFKIIDESWMEDDSFYSSFVGTNKNETYMVEGHSLKDVIIRIDVYNEKQGDELVKILKELDEALEDDENE